MRCLFCAGICAIWKMRERRRCKEIRVRVCLHVLHHQDQSSKDFHFFHHIYLSASHEVMCAKSINNDSFNMILNSRRYCYSPAGILHSSIVLKSTFHSISILNVSYYRIRVAYTHKKYFCKNWKILILLEFYKRISYHFVHWRINTPKLYFYSWQVKTILRKKNPINGMTCLQYLRSLN